MIHGMPKILGGPEMWEQLGQAIGFLGIDFFPAFWGFMAALSETIGGFFLLIGFMYRPACGFIFITMFVAATMHLGNGDGFIRASHAIENGIVIFSMIFIGPGRISIDEKFKKNTSNAG